MSSWCEIQLDTTAPQPQVYAPTWASVPLELPIRVEANEDLDPDRMQHSTLVDAAGNTIPVILTEDAGGWSAFVSTWDVAIGVATLTINVWDQAGNPATVTHSVWVAESAALQVTARVAGRTTAAAVSARTIAARTKGERAAGQARGRVTAARTNSRQIDARVAAREIAAEVAKIE